jgi:hypothetical protein
MEQVNLTKSHNVSMVQLYNMLQNKIKRLPESRSRKTTQAAFGQYLSIYSQLKYY